MAQTIREPAVSNAFYPANPYELEKMIDYFLNNAPLYNVKPEAVISPHAGYIYSGITAGYSYKQFLNLDKDKHYKVLLVGPSHFVPFEGISFGYYDYWETPFGKVPVDKKEIERFVVNNPNLPITLNTLPHIKEHSLEVQVPFLQKVLNDFSIIPVVYGQVLYQIVEKVIEEIKGDKNDVVVVISTDLSHYYPYKTARYIDLNCIKAVEELNLKYLSSCEACGKIGMEAIIDFAKKHNLKSSVLDYRTSGDTAGDKESVVGYLSAIFYKE
jgi:AmmeMemoRadiSam system protein B